MSEVTTDRVWYPPEFPTQGRLPSQAALVGKNCRQQENLERACRNELCQGENRLADMPCCKTLHISLFFDRTGNNLNNDLYKSEIKHPTNIARLFRAWAACLCAPARSATGRLFRPRAGHDSGLMKSGFLS